MSGQMCWLSPLGSDSEKTLHLRLQLNQSWKPYKSLPQYAVPDYKDFPNGSKGWATFQKLLKAGWTVVPSDKAYQTVFARKDIDDRLAG